MFCRLVLRSVRREVPCSLFPAVPISNLVLTLSKRGGDLVANILHRGVDVLEQPDLGIRERKRVEFDSAIYSQALSLLTEGNYVIFRLFKPGLSARSAKAVNVVKSLVLKSLVRIRMFNGTLLLDPNLILAQTDILGFKEIHRVLDLNISLLSKSNLRLFLASMPLADLVDEFPHLCALPTLVRRIVAKRDGHLLSKLLHATDGKEIEKICLQKHAVTGTPKYPWAHDWYLSQPRVALLTSTDKPLPHDILLEASACNATRNVPERNSVSFVLQSASELHLVNSATINEEFVGLSFVTPSVLSISTVSQSFVIDLNSVGQLGLHLLRQILANPKSIKIVYSLGAFLDRILDVSSDKVHFTNVVDLRTGRRTQTATRRSLSELVEEHLGRSHDRSVVFHPSLWEYRPLSVELQEFSANDSFYLVKLEILFRQQNWLPNEVMSFDPFV